ncbi:DUF3617 domain-containing protein [Ideonella sp. 4Y16]|uniref:DUF3617 domain-containing protein n=1 Tax=Ideonella alba TaxID=2824118 RepID=UPI001B35BAF9|nr:DUF3617 domain-containing protein [Ideonella alba]MBQ0945367.1 DUF3617 domain-containing protein [Ideonella alba]
MTHHIQARAVRTACWALLGLSAAAAAQTRLQPGLWEQTQQMKSGSGQMEAQMAQAQARLAALPPEQRKMVEQMMAQQGVGMGSAPASVRLCLSKEQTEGGDVPRADGRCTHQVSQRSGNTLHYSFQCNGNPPSSGEGDYTVNSPTSYSTQMTMKTVVKGQPETIQMTQQGRFVSSDCGALKPIQLPR